MRRAAHLSAPLVALCASACAPRVFFEPPGLAEAASAVYVVDDGAELEVIARRADASAPLSLELGDRRGVFVGLYPVALEALHLAEGPNALAVGGRRLPPARESFALDEDGERWEAIDAWPAIVADVAVADPAPPSPGALIDLSVGGSTSCALRGSGDVLCWGDGDAGRLAVRDVGLAERPTPTLVRGVERISLGVSFACALATSREVLCWGAGTSGTLGRALTDNTPEPAPVEGLRDAVAIRAGRSFACALGADGRVRCWGTSERGQAGPVMAEVHLPIELALPPVAELAVGETHGCARTPTGEIWCWGGNEFGQTDGRREGVALAPARVELAGRATAVAVGGFHSCARLADGEVWCWGRGDFGEAEGEPMQAPVRSALGDYPGALWASGYLSCVQLGDATLRCVGYSTDRRTRPEPLEAVGAVSALANGVRGHACALTPDRGVWCWGWGGKGQLGSLSELVRRAPARVPGVAGAAALLLDRSTSCIVDGAGQPACAGGSLAPLGGAAGATAPTPVRPIRALSLHANHGCVIDANGAPACYGTNEHGELGRPIEELRHADEPLAVPGLGPARSIAASDAGAYAVLEDGALMAWGANDVGQLGQGATGPVSTPVRVMDGARAVVAGRSHACALDERGEVWCWGDNPGGVLGLGQLGPELAPKRVRLDRPAVAICGVVNHVAVALDDGSVWCWGDNAHGECGDGTRENARSPVRSQGLGGVVALSCGDTHTCALGGDGRVHCMGDGHFGQLGADVVDRVLPAEVAGLSDVRAIASGDLHSCALDGAGEVRCWGSDGEGQLMLGTLVRSEVPRRVEGL